MKIRSPNLSYLEKHIIAKTSSAHSYTELPYSNDEGVPAADALQVQCGGLVRSDWLGDRSRSKRLDREPNDEGPKTTRNLTLNEATLYLRFGYIIWMLRGPYPELPAVPQIL